MTAGLPQNLQNSSKNNHGESLYLRFSITFRDVFIGKQMVLIQPFLHKDVYARYSATMSGRVAMQQTVEMTLMEQA